ncbi:hypothetical protein [Actinokineospora sp. NBRC 105648]|uniref:hypothetical protein n=1 Tax=Actinokineospora sp. NBRC 105648 TaxID=3032206 RepID=UPI0024A27349|nr:hypothetical protein [Actinokineospora sp. NBRC 105648]GLZ40397.1 hypothetical protein Acsp05_40210 [Actinokineospora sp. NBRC 105648]
MATSKRFGRYLGSTKNLVGCVGGLVGVVLHLFGVAGNLWLLVVVGLYLVGALAAPPEKVHLATDPNAEASRLRADLDALLAKVRAQADRMPEGALPRLERVAEILSAVLTRPAELAADPEAAHGTTRLVRVDVPLAVETYLNLPWWFAVAKKVNSGTPTAAEELTAQLELLEADAESVASAFFADDLRRSSDHTRYLRDRNQD